MSSAAPIHPLARWACRGRYHQVPLLLPTTPRRHLVSSTRSFQRKNPSQDTSAKHGQSKTPKDGETSTASSPSASTGDPAAHLAAIRSYRASPRGQPSSPPPQIKLIDKRYNPPPNSTNEEFSQSLEDREDTQKATNSSTSDFYIGSGSVLGDGGAQKPVRAGASKHPAAREQDRQANESGGGDVSSGDRAHLSQDAEEDIKGKVQEAAKSAAEASTLGATEQPPKSSSSSSSSPREGIVISPSDKKDDTSAGDSEGPFKASEGGSGDRDDGGGPPANTPQIPDIKQTRPPPIVNPFNTHVFIKRLEEAGFVPRAPKSRERAGDKHDQGLQLIGTKRHDPAEAVMEATKHLLVSRGEEVVEHHMDKTEAENQAYLFAAALSELRTEVQVRARNDAAAMRSMVTLLQREVDGLTQKMREDTAAMKHDIQVDMNNRKGEAKEEQNTLEQEIQDLNNRFTISISDLKTEIEQNIKWDATRRALTLVFGCVVILIATLALADYLGRENEGEDDVSSEDSGLLAGSVTSGGRGKAGSGPQITRSAEELGLLPNYDVSEGDGSRHV